MDSYYNVSLFVAVVFFFFHFDLNMSSHDKTLYHTGSILYNFGRFVSYGIGTINFSFRIWQKEYSTTL